MIGDCSSEDESMGKESRESVKGNIQLFERLSTQKDNNYSIKPKHGKNIFAQNKPVLAKMGSAVTEDSQLNKLMKTKRDMIGSPEKKLEKHRKNIFASPSTPDIKFEK